jgi:hypothetical protein
MFSRLARLIGSALIVAATTGASSSSYQPREAFAPFDMEQAVNRYRGGDGLPGPDYWQNRADYVIRATLDPTAHTINGEVAITYTNASPSALDVLWLQLEQNIYRPGSRGSLAQGGVPRGNTEGMTLDRVTVTFGKTAMAVTPLISDTRAQLPLPTPLAPGGKAVIHIRYHYEVPSDEFGGRTGWLTAKNGAPIYSVAQWYPRMAVFDDLRGWDPAPYLAQEFYLEYGNFDYFITVPSDMIVAGSGELVNPQEVLTPEQQARLAAARRSDRTVMIREPDRIGDPQTRPKAGSLTWHFHMDDSRDVAFSASSAFAWDAARINLPGASRRSPCPSIRLNRLAPTNGAARPSI